MKPDPRGKPDFRICDPACGTGGFLVCSYEWLVSREVSGGVFDRADARRIKSQTFIGQDLVPRPRRLAPMNLFLHGVEPHIYLGDAIYEPDHGERYDMVLTNPRPTARCSARKARIKRPTRRFHHRDQQVLAHGHHSSTSSSMS